MKSTVIKRAVIASVILCAALGLFFAIQPRQRSIDVLSARVAFKYVHDPMKDPKAAADIVVNPDAVYGFSPNPASTRLGNFANAIDWTKPEDVAKARAIREAYLERNLNLWKMFSDMKAEGRSTEEIARAVSRQRNINRLAELDKEDMALAKASNLNTYGNEEGPTADYLYQKYGSWETVIEKAMSASNPGMDACCGLYDDCYPLYRLSDELPGK